MMDNENQISGLLITAGMSERMKEFKPVMLINGIPFITEIIRKMKIICNEIVVVVGFQKEKIQNEIEKYFPNNSGIQIVINKDYGKGMFTSLQCGMNHLINSNWVLYHFVDQPGLPDSFYNEFICQIDEKFNWIQPSYKTIKGHPIVFSKEIYQLIINASEENNLKDISQYTGINKKIWECDYSNVLQDIDTIKDYKREILNESF
jgi:molybdenum cofactor cytidylyltransferase